MVTTKYSYNKNFFRVNLYSVAITIRKSTVLNLRKSVNNNSNFDTNNGGKIGLHSLKGPRNRQLYKFKSRRKVSPSCTVG